MGRKTNSQLESQGRGASARSGSSHSTNRRRAKKIFNKKGQVIGSVDPERDKRDEQEWLKQGDPKANACEAGREAAYDKRCEEEECRQVTGQLARKSANKTGDGIGEILDRYETIVLELLTARYTGADGKRYSLGIVLRGKYESDSALKEFLPKFAKWIGEYFSDCVREHSFEFTPLYRQTVPARIWTLCGHSVSKALLTALALEYARDREGLMQFLSEVFKQWRKLFAPSSRWRQRVVTLQHAHGIPHHRIAQRLERIEAVPKGSAVPGTENYRKLRSRIKKDLSRDPKTALMKR